MRVALANQQFKIRCCTLTVRVRSFVKFPLDVPLKHTTSKASHVLLLRFSQTCEFWSSKANWRLRFSLPSIILTNLLGTKLYYNGFKRSWFVICNWWISIRFVCFCVWRVVAFDRNYDWRQRKTQLWRRLLNLRVRMFVKSALMINAT